MIDNLKVARPNSDFKQRLAAPYRPGLGEASRKSNAPVPVIAVPELLGTDTATEAPPC